MMTSDLLSINKFSSNTYCNKSQYKLTKKSQKVKFICLTLDTSRRAHVTLSA